MDNNPGETEPKDYTKLLRWHPRFSHTERQLILKALEDVKVGTKEALQDLKGTLYVFTSNHACINGNDSNGHFPCVEYYKALSKVAPNLNFKLFSLNTSVIGPTESFEDLGLTEEANKDFKNDIDTAFTNATQDAIIQEVNNKINDITDMTGEQCISITKELVEVCQVRAIHSLTSVNANILTDQLLKDTMFELIKTDLTSRITRPQIEQFIQGTHPKISYKISDHRQRAVRALKQPGDFQKKVIANKAMGCFSIENLKKFFNKLYDDSDGNIEYTFLDNE